MMRGNSVQGPTSRPKHGPSLNLGLQEASCFLPSQCMGSLILSLPFHLYL